MLSNFFRSAFKDNGKRSSYYVIYTLFFGIIAVLCFSWFIFLGYSLIWEHDGWKQHFVALVYYAKYLREIVRHLLFDHKFIVPDWDFYIGEGTGILNALHYYVIGDPLTLLSVFVPTRHMHYFFSLLCVFRLYLSGISFSELCFGTGQHNRYAVLTGAIAYSFCNWALIGATYHPYFVNPMIYFPLMILGIEKIIRKEKPHLFILSAAVSAASNFYFFYMIVILAVMYALIRLAFLYNKDIKQGVITLLHMGVMAVIGVCIAGIIIIPVLMMFLQESRLSVSLPFRWFYPLSYYSQLPSVFVSIPAPSWSCMGFSAPVILAIFLLFIRGKKETFLKTLVGIGIILFLFPIGGRLLNGMAYTTNRWSWAFTLLCTYILVKKWEDFKTLTSKEWKFLVICSTVLFALSLLFRYSRNNGTYVALSLLFITLIIIRTNPSGKREVFYQQALLFLLVVCGAFNLSFWYFSPSANNHISLCKENRRIQGELNNTEAKAVKEISESSYPRMSGRYLNMNVNILNDISSTQYYWSISNPDVNNFRTSMSLREPLFSYYKGYDDRTALIGLSAVQYYTVGTYDNQSIPYGYSLLSSNDQFSIYQNDYTLPIGYCYDSYFLRDTWDSYDPVQKQEAQLEAAFADTEIKGIEQIQPTIPDYTVPFEIECLGENITQSEDGFITTAKNAQLKLILPEELLNSEIYLRVEGFDVEFTPTYDLYFGDESVDPLNQYNEENWRRLSKINQLNIRNEKLYWNPVREVIYLSVDSSSGSNNTLEYRQPEVPFSSGRHDYIVNLRYSEEPVSSITITFPEAGRYSISRLLVYSVPMDEYPSKMANLQENTLQNVQLGTDELTGEISLNEPKLLCVAIPFSTGWEAFIDDNKTDVHLLNERYMGILVPSGTHQIKFHYTMPFKKAGIAISILGLLAFILVIIRYAHKPSAAN